MKRVWGHGVAGLLVLACGAVVFPACAHNDSSLFVRFVFGPQTTTQPGAVCTFAADPTQLATSAGLLDIAVRSQYDGVFLVGNQLVPESNPSQLQTETSTVTIQGAVVRVTSARGDVLARYTRLASATLAPASGNTPGYGVVSDVTIVDQATAAAIPDFSGKPLGQSGNVRLITYTRFFGVTLGGKSVESDEFEFPVDVCNGCLVRFTNAAGHPVPNCAATATATQGAQQLIPCIIGEDLSIDCNLVCNNIPTCRANSS